VFVASDTLLGSISITFLLYCGVLSGQPRLRRLPMINVSETAASKISELLAEEN
jgi:hypothetical protein